MKFTIITLFPEIIQGSLTDSIMKRAIEAKHIEVEFIQLRDFAVDKHGTVDDVVYGGGHGLLLMPQPLSDAIAKARETNQGKIVFFTPQGKRLEQTDLEGLAKAKEDLIFICGHYEGIDQRIRDKYVDIEISIGDYVLTGGELPASILIDGITRLLPGVISDPDSHYYDSFSPGLNRKKEYPNYTRPAEFEGMEIPEVLLSGHHANIQKWRDENCKD